MGQVSKTQTEQIVFRDGAWRGGVVLSPLLVFLGKGLYPGSVHKAQTGPLSAITDLEGLA